MTTQSSQLAYQLSSDEWEGKWTLGVAVSASLPDNMLVTCEGKPYVYQFPCHQATQEVKKYKIQGGKVNPWFIVANANTAAVAIINADNSIVICSLPFYKSSQVGKNGTKQGCLQSAVVLLHPFSRHPF